MEAYVASVVFVVLAEMGDKTQLLGMAFATRFKALTVLAGVLVATLANHLLAVFLGDYLTTLVPLERIQLATALSFVFFGLWTLRGDRLEGEDRKDYFNPFWTVTIAFFLAEMGDKTQLASVALAARYHALVPVWLGTTTGMIISNVIGITFGVVMGKSIPERTVKLVSAGVFILFGYLGVLASIEDLLVKTGVLAAVTLVVLLYCLHLGRAREKARR